MNLIARMLVLLVVMGLAGTFGYRPAMKYWKDRNRPNWETEKVVRGDAAAVVISTGTVRPVLSVSIGSFVSGPIVELKVDHNDQVKKGDVLAKIDPRLFEANVARDEAILATREAEVDRVKAQLQQAKNNKLRGENLRAKNKDFLSDREMDALRFECDALVATVKLAEAAVLQARASLENSRANLEYTVITSPVDGIVLSRKIEPGQTLAAQFQTPELFVVAPDLRQEVYVFASVDETDIGRLQQAQRESRPVTFTVDAHPEEMFAGKIRQIRMSSVDVQTVVTYPVIVSAPNPDLKLIPGMTASISFETDYQRDVLKIPTAALRFYPEDTTYVREEDRQLLDVSRWQSSANSDQTTAQSAKEKTEAEVKKNHRHVWVIDSGLLRAVEVVTGISESKYVVLTKGELREGDQLVTGIRKRK